MYRSAKKGGIGLILMTSSNVGIAKIFIKFILNKIKI